jgi:hypothetical protein
MGGQTTEGFIAASEILEMMGIVRQLINALPEVKERWRVLSKSSKCYEPYVGLAQKFFEYCKYPQWNHRYANGWSVAKLKSTMTIAESASQIGYSDLSIAVADKYTNQLRIATAPLDYLIPRRRVSTLNDGVTTSENPFLFFVSQFMLGQVDVIVDAVETSSGSVDAVMPTVSVDSVAGFISGTGAYNFTRNNYSSPGTINVNASVAKTESESVLSGTSTYWTGYTVVNKMMGPVKLEEYIQSMSGVIRSIEYTLDLYRVILEAISTAATHPSGTMRGTGGDLIRSYVASYLAKRGVYTVHPGVYNHKDSSPFIGQPRWVQRFMSDMFDIGKTYVEQDADILNGTVVLVDGEDEDY